MAYGTNAPYGLKPLKFLSGATWNNQVTPYFLDTTNTFNIYTNDPVIAASTGAVRPALNSAGQYSGASTGVLLGSFQGCSYVDTYGVRQWSKYWGQFPTMAGTQVVAYVADDPNIIFSIQASNSNSGNATAASLPLGIQQSAIFLNAVLAFGGNGFTDNPSLVANNPTSGSTTTGQSVYYLDATSGTGAPATTNTFPLKIIGFAQDFPIVSPSTVASTTYPNAFTFSNGPIMELGTPYVALGTGLVQGAFNNVLVINNNHPYKAVGVTGV